MTNMDRNQTKRTTSIIAAPDETFNTTATIDLWITDGHVYAPKCDGNAVHPFLTGKAYFADLIEKMESASGEICIAGWQINWDALLAPGKRLYDVLLNAARKKGMKIYVMPWDDTRPVRTYEAQTIKVLKSINQEPDVAPGTVAAIASPSFNLINKNYFSHHQKTIIIDRRYAYVGGIDLAYGRYDDERFTLKCDEDGREVMNRYNPCIPALLAVPEPITIDPNKTEPISRTLSAPTANPDPPRNDTMDKLNGGRKSLPPEELRTTKASKWQVPYDDPGTVDIITNGRSTDTPSRLTLDPARQARMPWQDMHARMEGPCVSDILRNFMDRWHVSGGVRLPPAPPMQQFAAAGSTMVQVLRSASAGQRKLESGQLNKTDSHPCEDHIKQAMCKLIKKADHFIYIENQFFVGKLGKPVHDDPSGDSQDLSPAANFINAQKHGLGKIAKWTLRKNDANKSSTLYEPPTNPICEALIERITRAILNAEPQPFHVYITLPVHPEGDFFTTASVAVQIYWTMQTLSFGTNSLLNGIRRALRARQLRDKGDKNYERLLTNTTQDMSKELEHIPVEACFEYVTLLNLRNWAKLGERYVTEQVYVHTKLMIVDDRYALFGSANINDRSLNGEGDSEIALLVTDQDVSKADLCGDGVKRPVRNFARKLRMDIWRKLFGIGLKPSAVGGVKPADHLLSAIEKPAAPASWRAIQKQAEENAAAYEAVFDYIPRSWRYTAAGQKKASSIIPNWDPQKKPPIFESSGWCITMLSRAV
ncbi:phospholipase D-like domain-containing protein [Herbaspirillum rubrisubalbicans]|uniref:phospholipase D-like domain-containing protein n=1 Tax=Herbaspirillum rubrisubalbicans TaxID=80842 RepID=UPI0020A6B380|nr:phospholipase D-like domain-containing protein [Herbaspirillum rubrisubalbicans]